MRIGIGEHGFSRWGDERFHKIKECGYDCVDYALSDTDMAVYHCDDTELEVILGRERKLIEEAGLFVNQIHGPWRWPPQDRTKEEQGVTICLENMPMGRFSMGSALNVLEFAREMNDENFKICLDTGHAAIYDQGKPAEMVRALKDEIRVLHVHDNDGYRDIHQMPYFGVIDWQEFGQALNEIGYDGVFNFETAPPGNMPDGAFEEMCKALVKVAKEVTSVV